MDLLSVQSEEDSGRSRWLWVALILLLLLFLLGLAWFWWSGSGTTTRQAASHPLMKTAAASDVATPPVAPPPELPATSYDVQFGYHQSAIKTNEAVSSAFEAWRSYDGRQCGGACACEKSAKIDVVGHADRRTGTRDFNRCISWKRASVVADALAGLGVPRCDVTAAFVGDTATLSPESDEASAAKHRNATITIVAANAASPRCDGACKSSLSPSEIDHCEVKLKQRPLLHID